MCAVGACTGGTQQQQQQWCEEGVLHITQLICTQLFQDGSKTCWGQVHKNDLAT